MLPRALLVVFLAASGVAVPAADDAPPVPGIEDVLTLKTVAGVQISPDGKWVVYGVTETDFEQDAFVTQLWAVPTSGGTPVQLTSRPRGNRDPDRDPAGFTLIRPDDGSEGAPGRP